MTEKNATIFQRFLNTLILHKKSDKCLSINVDTTKIKKSIN